MIAVPFFFAVIFPFDETDATDGLEEVYRIVRLALPFESFTLSERLFPFFSFFEPEGLSITLEGAFFTVILMEAFAPLERLAVIVADPLFFVVILPDLDTAATDDLLLW